ncbi:YdbH domain-containing protein [Colwellia sp. BRX8-7]|uniref:intermembrane phospholipid transport protein YdbH family protein n=1 Tax=Colwellia sp. BRX8-7 TaxID=2759833 RepID=UPI0015F64177|nr:YdbH domain-containing protein [Colwellia sp. BRX8-7]MBA6335791.1 YdbH domain-containing protein [Colwellia sp. BRX8-7]
MRFLKFILIAVITLLIIFTITYSARVSVINYLVKTQFNSDKIALTCLNVSLTSNMAIRVNKACLQTPKANIQIVGMIIQWQLSPSLNITDIDIRLAEIEGTDHLFSKKDDALLSKEQENQNLSQLLSTSLQTYAQQIKQFNLPKKTNVTKLFYSPFTVSNKTETKYIANLSTLANNLSFTLTTSESVVFIEAKLTQENEGFSIAISSKLSLLKSFLSAHRLPITAGLTDNLTASEISGDFNTQIKYRASAISLKNQISNISIISENGIGNSGPFKLLGALNFDSQFDLIAKETTNEVSAKDKITVALTFVGKNEISVEYSQPQLLAKLTQAGLSPTMMSILEENPLTHVTIKPQGNGLLTLNDSKGYLSHLEISAFSGARPHQVKFDNITFALPTPQTPYALAVERFVIDSQLKLVNIAKYTPAPVALHLNGSLNKTEQTTTINLTADSSITLNNIVVLKQMTEDKNNNQTHNKITTKTSTAQKPQALLSLKKLTTKLTGSVALLEDNNLNIKLKVDNHVSQLNIPKKLKITSFNIFSELNGSFDDIQLNAQASADGVKLGNLVLTGPVKSPNVVIAAKNLQLTDLLSLNIQLPTEVELIDGLLDYNIFGQINALNNIENTPFNVSVAITSLSGEINGIWLQELNWQQHFSLLAGKITTQPNAKENLTVELIETVTPISKLSINTNWTFDKSFQLSANKLKANVLGGSFFIPNIQWPVEHGHSVNVQLNSIDLEQVLALDEKQGIVVTGNISGQLPVTFDGDKYIIEKGELHNISNGLIQVIDNPAVEELKANNSQLKLAFDALQNLHYHQLSSAVTMADDGYMQLNTVIKGRNPDIDNDVNLNLNLSYDLLGLLESLSITQRFEESLIKGLQKKKE